MARRSQHEGRGGSSRGSQESHARVLAKDNDDVDESLGVSRMKGGTRRRYGGRQDFDDLSGGADDVCNQNRPIRSKKG